MKIQLLIILVFTSLEVIGSTPQIPDKLIYQETEYEWYGYSPAVDYFEKKNFKPPKEAIETTANYGVFLFTYSIEQDSLYLTDVEILVSIGNDNGPPDLGEKSVFKLYFPNTDKVLMENYSNIQVIPFGDQIKSTKKGWTTFHSENYLVFDFKNGAVINDLKLNYKQYQKLKKEQFQKFKRSNNYKTQIENTQEDLEHFNEFRPEKITMDEYLELHILDILDHLQ